MILVIGLMVSHIKYLKYTRKRMNTGSPKLPFLEDKNVTVHPPKYFLFTHLDMWTIFNWRVRGLSQ